MSRRPKSALLLGALLALLTLTAATPTAPVPDQVWGHPELERLRPQHVAILPVVSFVYLPRERAYVEDAWLQRMRLSYHDWLPAVLCRERMASTSRGGDSLLSAIGSQVRSRGRVDSTSSPHLARLLHSQALLCLRIDRWERIGEARSTRVYVDMTAALVDSTGRLLWRVVSRECLESVYGVPKAVSVAQPAVPASDMEYERWRASEEAATRGALAGRPGEMGVGYGPTAIAADFHEAVTRILARWARRFPESPRRPAGPTP